MALSGVYSHEADQIIVLHPRVTKRSVGRPQKRWDDDIHTKTGGIWIRASQDWKYWKLLGEAFIQEWIDY